jgi:pSer/pThr/pTyr-binding forkhead associated (FHA) protein
MFDNKKNIEIKFSCLIGIAGEYEGQVIKLLDKLSLGRHQKNDLQFHDHAVSAFHVEIIKVDNNYEIRDLGSKNRAKVNGRKIFKPTILVNDYLIDIGKNSFRFSQPIAEIINVDATMPINNKRPDQLNVDITLPIAKPGFGQAKPTNKGPKQKQEIVTGGGPLPEWKIDPSRNSKKELPRPRKILVNAISVCMVLFIIILVIAKSSSHIDTPTGKVFSGSSTPITLDKRQEYIKNIWAKWENPPSQPSPDMQQAIDLLDHAQGLFVQTQSKQISTAPKDLWLIYKECLKALSYTKNNPDYTEIRTQCQHLRKALQIAIELQENHYYTLYFTNKTRGNPEKALAAVDCNMQLFDLDGDNQDVELAKLYRRLCSQINQDEKIRRQGK